jgi:hypothetical protein
LVINIYIKNYSHDCYQDIKLQKPKEKVGETQEERQQRHLLTL